MKALIVIDVQNEFTEKGKRPVVDISDALEAIKMRVEQAREKDRPIAWIRHFNKPNESVAFVPGSWGAEFIPGFGPTQGSDKEIEMHKNVYGAFTGTEIGNWLKKVGANEILIVGFYSHGCVSTTSREAIMAGLTVFIDPAATGSCDMEHEILGRLTAAEVKRSSLLHLANMGAVITPLHESV